MKTIPAEYTRKGYTYHLLERQKDVALFQIGRADCYEVVIVRRHQGRTLPDGRTIEAAEYLPSDEEFGTKGWYFCDRARALAKFAEAVEEQNKPKHK